MGTLNTTESAGRKMKSPPGDIFIYGVHPDTTEEDIVNDLKESDITIELKDIVKKSKPEAGLNSYKISVKSEDLQKALNPNIWPIRVKVREYIYYSKRPQHAQRQGGQGQRQPGHGGHGGGNGGPGTNGGQGSYGGYGDQGVGGYSAPGGHGWQGGYGGHRAVDGGAGQVKGQAMLPGVSGQWNGAPTSNRFETEGFSSAPTH